MKLSREKNHEYFENFNSPFIKDILTHASSRCRESREIHDALFTRDRVLFFLQLCIVIVSEYLFMNRDRT